MTDRPTSEYMAYAVQCRALADAAKDRKERDGWESLARHWLRMAATEPDPGAERPGGTPNGSPPRTERRRQDGVRPGHARTPDKKAENRPPRYASR